MMNHRDHPFNRSTRPLLERNNSPHDDNDGDHLPHHANYSAVTSGPTAAPTTTVVSAPNSAQIMRGFHDFHYVPKTSFYGGYPYGSPPSPTRPGPQHPPHHHHHQQQQTNDAAISLTMAAASQFAFSDDSGVHTTGGSSSTGSSPNTSTISSTPQHQQHNHYRQTTAAAAPPPPPQRYYVDDAADAEVDGRWRPYGSHIAATKGPFIFGMTTTSTTMNDSSKTSVIQAASDAVASGKRTKKMKKSKGDRKAAKMAVPTPPVRSIKCVVVGDAAVGKTNLICSYLENRFVSEHIPTASDQYNFEVTVDDSPVHVTLCDTAGQDTLDALRQLSYPDADCFVLCFSCVRPETFRALQRKWLPQLLQQQQQQQKQHRKAAAAPVVLLVGTQSDLRTDAAVLGALQRNGEQPVAAVDACAVAQALGGQYLETSSRYRVGVKDAFDAAIWQALLVDRRGGKGESRALWRRLLCMA